MLGAAGLQLIGLVAGAGLREAVHRLTGGDPRAARVWVGELVVLGVLAGVLGAAFGSMINPIPVGGIFGAGLTTYAAVSAAHGYASARSLRTFAPWKWAVAHFVACTTVGTVVFTAALLMAGASLR